jgi:hypothetical protein
LRWLSVRCNIFSTRKPRLLHSPLMTSFYSFVLSIGGQGKRRLATKKEGMCGFRSLIIRILGRLTKPFNRARVLACRCHLLVCHKVMITSLASQPIVRRPTALVACLVIVMMWLVDMLVNSLKHPYLDKLFCLVSRSFI